MTYNVLMGTLNPTHSLAHSLAVLVKPVADFSSVVLMIEV